MDRQQAIASAFAHVLERQPQDFPPDSALGGLGVDSIALVVLADVVEAANPGWRLPDSVLKTARTVGDLALGLEQL